MPKNLILAIALVLIAASSAAPFAGAADPEVGTVTRLQNSANVMRQGQALELHVGTTIQENDEIQSSKDARVEITFTDGTKLIIGENSIIIIDKYLFDPDADIGTVLLRALQGPFRFITGNIGKVEKKQIEVQSRFGVIGVRGTDFWAGPSQNVYGVVLLEGIITVFNSEGGRILSSPGEGVNLTSANEPPGEVAIWGAARAQAALEAVAFK